jgi:hypothetical protein
MEDVLAHHQKLRDLVKQECNVRLLKFIMSWPLYGATIFEVLVCLVPKHLPAIHILYISAASLTPKQSYTTTLPKNLWLAVNEEGIHIMRRRAKEPLISYGYRNIVNYSPSLRNLMIVTESLTRGTKFVFNTSQVRFCSDVEAVNFCILVFTVFWMVAFSYDRFDGFLTPAGVTDRPSDQGLHLHHHPAQAGCP